MGVFCCSGKATKINAPVYVSETEIMHTLPWVTGLIRPGPTEWLYVLSLSDGSLLFTIAHPNSGTFGSILVGLTP